MRHYASPTARPSLRERLADERGASMVEYGLILALVSIVAIVALGFLGSATEEKFACSSAAVADNAPVGVTATAFHDLNENGNQDNGEPLVSDCD